jgi:hypothetical protein
MIEIINPASPFEVPKQFYKRYVALSDVDAYTTAHIFTATNAGTATVAAASYTGRPCLGVTYNSNITDGLQLQVPVASVIPQIGQPIYIKASFASSIMGTAEFAFGLHDVDTSIIASKGTDYIICEKLVGASAFNISCRKASGTAEKIDIAMPTLASATWYDFVMKCERDPVTAGRGLITFGYKVSGVPGDAMQWMAQWSVPTQFPNTVAQAPCIATRSGYAAAVNYMGYLAWSI